MSDELSKTAVEFLHSAIKDGFTKSESSFQNMDAAIERIRTEIQQLTVRIERITTEVKQLESGSKEQREEMLRLENKLAAVEKKQSELELEVNLSIRQFQSDVPRDLNARVAIMEASQASTKKLGWFMVTAFTGLVIKTLWDLMSVTGG